MTAQLVLGQAALYNNDLYDSPSQIGDIWLRLSLHRGLFHHAVNVAGQFVAPSHHHSDNQASQ